MKQAYLKIYAYDVKGECSDIKVIEVKNGKIVMKEAIGQPEKENIGKKEKKYLE
jgi:hypothetical protein